MNLEIRDRDVAPGGSRSKTDSSMLMPPTGDTAGTYRQLQGKIDTNPMQEEAMASQLGLRGRMRELLGQEDQGQRARINQQFQSVADAETQRLASRGLPQTQTPPAQSAFGGLTQPGFRDDTPGQQSYQNRVQQEQQLAAGDLQDRLTNRSMASETSISNQLSKLLFGSSSQATDLMKALLGSGRVGTFSVSKTNTLKPKPSGYTI